MTNLLVDLGTFLAGAPTTCNDSNIICEGFIEHSAKWIISQVQWLIIVAVVILGIQAWFKGTFMAFFGIAIVGAILYLFTTGDQKGFMNGLTNTIQGIFNYKGS